MNPVAEVLRAARAITTPQLAIGAAALLAEDRADDIKRTHGQRLAALHEAEHLWDEAFGHMGDEGDHWSRRRVG